MQDHEKIGAIGTIITGTALVAMLFAAALWATDVPAAVASFVAMLAGYVSNVAFAYERRRLQGGTAVVCVIWTVGAAIILVL